MTDELLKGGLLARFDVKGEQLSIWITNPQTAKHALALEIGHGIIPVGRVHRGSGQGQHNRPWSWHVDPDDIELVESAIELCDGLPSYVEAHLDEWIAQNERYCPWHARLIAREDHR